jgi:phosphatidylinositol kinase/protein kinase (PI-3  family)
LRQERLAVQLIKQIDLIFKEFKLPLYLLPYRVVAVSSESGLIETVTNAITLDSLKGIMGPNSTLMDYFRLMYGSEQKRAFRRARENFISSMAAYSLVCYILQIKDRHGGNIMIDADGYVVRMFGLQCL